MYISGSMVFPAGSVRRNSKLSPVTSMSVGTIYSTAFWSTSLWVKRPLMYAPGGYKSTHSPWSATGHGQHWSLDHS